MSTPAGNFIHDIIDADLESGKRSEVVTRFPPEPNGYLHIGHAKAICLDFGTALKYNGRCHLRFDDTNPTAEDTEYVEAIKEDVHWLGFDWGEHLYWASDYFEQMYEYAVQLIKQGKAYVCDLSVDAFKEYRGIPTEPGKEPEGRQRSIEENLELFEKMKAGEFADGAYVLRARIDMASPNLHMRDPAIYRIKHASHHNTGDQWCIYPMYDFAHCIEDSIEGVTHSLCTLEFEVHRPLYDWILKELEAYQPQQIEFARLNLTYTVMSKRKLLELVQKNLVNGWDDPRMPTLCGMRRRGYPAQAIRNFCTEIGITKTESLSDVALLEHHVRDILNEKAPRRMAVLDPLKVVITNYPEEQTETFDLPNHPNNEEVGTRSVPFTRELFIEKSDYLEDAPNKYKRFTIGREVRLRGAYLATCNEAIKDADGNVIELRCTIDPESKGGSAPDGRKVKGTIHWVSATEGVEATVHLYDRLFGCENPAAEEADFKELLNPESLQTVTGIVEPEAISQPGEAFQFERIGYFCIDKDSTADVPVLNRTVGLRDSWNK
ncbi:glutamine--tRNA ligase/YqeY domain fusion protein [Tichowtungia aerotolerans]|uniref:Glutamine--tRNA ligase n=1 Tax=Tichowtungia aerotolerans TaxID=2697043 RepID=A0A6P1MAC1_9BACT|nr:glutamine--tRNA ligase/YqeY domain fusion protein [Tichowtungia aerotolerans]QHI68075.1 glutamine--tRNA ligase/YqeY domain fusion protein [Tichowtungia aerotolerans]